MGWIFYLSSLSSPPGQELFPGQDKVEHFLLYLILGVLLFRARTTRRGTWSTALGCAYAVSDELHQQFVPGRTGDVLDILVDCAAVAAGVALIMRFRRRARRPAKG